MYLVWFGYSSIGNNFALILIILWYIAFIIMINISLSLNMAFLYLFKAFAITGIIISGMYFLFNQKTDIPT
jgi:hypothetical protein